MSEKVTFKELVAQIAKQSRQSQSSTNNFIQELVKIIEKGLRESGTVSISGFGKFELRNTNPRQSLHPETGEQITTPGQNRVVFKPFKNLRDEVNQPFAALTAKILKETAGNDGETGGPAAFSESGDTEPQNTSEPGSESLDDLLIEHENPRFRNIGPASATDQKEPLTPGVEDGTDQPEPDGEKSLDNTGPRQKEESGFIAAGTPLSALPEEKTLADEVQRAGTFRWSYAAAAIVAILVFIILFFLYQQYQEASDRPSQAMPGIQNQPQQTETLSPADAGQETEDTGTDPQPGIASETPGSTPAETEPAPDGEGEQEPASSATASQPGTPSTGSPQAAADGAVQNGTTPAAADATQTRFDTENFSVEPGQSLWTIAETQLGNPYLWPVLYHLNQDKLGNPNFLPADSDILLPSISDPDNLNEFEREQVARGYFDLYEWNLQHSPEEARFFLWAVGVFSANLLDQPPSDVNQEDLEFARNR